MYSNQDVEKNQDNSKKSTLTMENIKMGVVILIVVVTLGYMALNEIRYRSPPSSEAPRSTNGPSYPSTSGSSVYRDSSINSGTSTNGNDYRSSSINSRTSTFGDDYRSSSINSRTSTFGTNPYLNSRTTVLERPVPTPSPASRPAQALNETNIFLFSEGKNMMKLNLANKPLKIELIESFENDSLRSPQYSPDGSNIYYTLNDQIMIHNGAELPISDCVSEGKFIFNKANTNEIIYVAKVEKTGKVEYTISRVDKWTEFEFKFFDTSTQSTSERTLKHKCDYGNTPIIASHFSDGSKLVYRCSVTHEVYLKDMNDDEVEDVQLFKGNWMAEFVLSPDDTKLFYCHDGYKYCLLLDISNPSKVSEREIPMSASISGGMAKIRHFEFSNDSKILYILNTALERKQFPYELYTIDFEKVLNSPNQKHYDKLRIRKIVKPENYVEKNLN